MILESIFYYIFCTSAVLIYGVGLKKAIITSKSWKKHWFDYLESAILCILVSISGWFTSVYILAPVGMLELTAISTIILYLFFAMIVSFLFSKLKETSLLDISIAFPCVFIALIESFSVWHCLCISLCCCTSYYLLIPVIYAIKERIKTCHTLKEFKTGSLIFISIAIIICAMYATNISWLNLRG